MKPAPSNFPRMTPTLIYQDAPKAIEWWSVTASSVVMPDSPLASAPSQKAASSSSAVSAIGASDPSAAAAVSRGVHRAHTRVSSKRS